MTLFPLLQCLTKKTSTTLQLVDVFCRMAGQSLLKKRTDRISEGVTYKTLPSKTIEGLDYEVREGCGAMQIYREMIRGIGASNPTAKAELAEILRNYVTLDTASQWIIFEHWRQRVNITES